MSARIFLQNRLHFFVQSFARRSDGDLHDREIERAAMRLTFDIPWLPLLVVVAEEKRHPDCDK